MNKLDINELLKLTGSGLYCLINNSSKKVYLGYGVNILNSLQRILTRYKANSLGNRKLHDELPQLEFKLLEYRNCPSFVLKVLTNEYISKYKEDGYEVLNYRNPIKLDLIKYIEGDEIVLGLRTQNRKKVVLHRFRSNRELEDFSRLIKDWNRYIIDVLVGT